MSPIGAPTDAPSSVIVPRVTSCFLSGGSTSKSRTLSWTRGASVETCSETVGMPAMVRAAPPVSCDTGTSYVTRLPGTIGDSGGMGSGRSSRAASITSGSQKKPAAGSVSGFTSNADSSNSTMTSVVASAARLDTVTTFAGSNASSRGRVSAACTTCGGTVPSPFI